MFFWAGTQTTERVESINSFFDEYLTKHTRLFKFAPRYCKAMESRAEDEKVANANCIRYLRPLMTEFSVERRFQKLYTDAKFHEVQIQCTRVALTTISCKDISNQVVLHTLSDRVWIYSKFLKREIALTGQKREYNVTFNKDDNVATCDCKHFECHGIICRHIIKVFGMHDIHGVPDMYILDRWRKDIQRKHTLVKVAYHDPSKTEEVKRYDNVLLEFEPVLLRSSLCDKFVDLVLEMIQLMSIRLDESEREREVGESNNLEGENGNEVPLTPASVNKVKEIPSTPASVNRKRKGKAPSTFASVNQENDVLPPLSVNDPIPKAKKPHRTCDTRYKSGAEKPKTPKRGKSKANNAADEETDEEPEVDDGHEKTMQPLPQHLQPIVLRYQFHGTTPVLLYEQPNNYGSQIQVCIKVYIIHKLCIHKLFIHMH